MEPMRVIPFFISIIITVIWRLNHESEVDPVLVQLAKFSKL